MSQYELGEKKFLSPASTIKGRLALSFGNTELRRISFEVLTLLTTGAILYYLGTTAARNLVDQGITSGFGFLDQEAGYAIGESWIEYSPSDTYTRALLVGFLNTLYVTFITIVLTTVIGTLMGIARVSSNWLLSRLSAAYVEIFRNTPLLLQIIFWIAVMRQLPPPREAINPIDGLYLTNRGIIHSAPLFDATFYWVILALVLGLLASIGFIVWRKKQLYKTGQAPPIAVISLALITVPPAFTWFVAGGSFELEKPVLSGFNFVGGMTHSPELLALVLGLVAYTSAFVAEIVRSGIESVDVGQRDAARSIGLRNHQVLSLVILPQALRVVVPPLTNQYVNLAKDSSLAVAIGYPDLVSVGNTAINQTGQAIEILFLMMIVYVGISAGVALLMNWYNRRIALKESP